MSADRLKRDEAQGAIKIDPGCRRWPLMMMAILAVTALSACSALRQAGRRALTLRGRLADVRSFAVVYSRVEVGSLEPFDLLILDGDVYTSEELEVLRSEGKILLAYLNVGEIELYRPYARLVPSDWLLGPNPDWPDHFFVDPGRRGWWNILAQNAIEPLLRKGFQGFLLDSVDLASSERYPQVRSGMIDLIRWLHHRYSAAILVLNNGFFLLDEVRDQVDAVLVEEVYTTLGENGEVGYRSSEEAAALVHRIAQAQRRWHLPAFLLDYCQPAGLKRCREWSRQSRSAGLVHSFTDPAVSRAYPEMNSP